MKPEHVAYLLNFSLLTRIRHWQTTNYAEHMALGALYDALDEFIDSWVEKQQGASSSRLVIPAGMNLALDNISGDDYKGMLFSFDTYLRQTLVAGGDGTEFVNMRDDLLAKVKQAQYLLSLM